MRIQGIVKEAKLEKKWKVFVKSDKKGKNRGELLPKEGKKARKKGVKVEAIKRSHFKKERV